MFTPLFSSILESLKAGWAAELISGTIILMMEGTPVPSHGAPPSTPPPGAISVEAEFILFVQLYGQNQNLLNQTLNTQPISTSLVPLFPNILQAIQWVPVYAFSFTD